MDKQTLIQVLTQHFIDHPNVSQQAVIDCVTEAYKLVLVAFNLMNRFQLSVKRQKNPATAPIFTKKKHKVSMMKVLMIVISASKIRKAGVNY